MSDYPDTPKDYIIASYRYLRLAMVILVVTLAVSLVIEISRASCWQGSISAYYYTPVHSVFVGALVAIGVALVALRAERASRTCSSIWPACSPRWSRWCRPADPTRCAVDPATS